jgi:hypothetical protein
LELSLGVNLREIHARRHIDNGSQLDRTGAQTNPLQRERGRGAIAAAALAGLCGPGVSEQRVFAARQIIGVRANTDSQATKFINPLSFGDEFIFAQFDKRHLGAQIAARARAAYSLPPRNT